MKSIPVVVCLSCVALSGCGLSDYQTRMDAQAARVRDFDETNRLLDDPVETPKMTDPTDPQKEKSAWPFEFFLRLPRGYTTAPKDKNPYSKGFPFFRFAGGSEGAISIFFAAAFVAEPDGENEWDKFHPTAFRDWIKLGILDYYQQTNKISITIPEKIELQTREIKPLTPYPSSSTAKITYKTFTCTDEGNKLIKDQSVFEIHIREEGRKQVCIVVQRPLQVTNQAAFNKSIEACLGSLEIGGKASTKRMDFKRAKAP